MADLIAATSEALQHMTDLGARTESVREGVKRIHADGAQQTQQLETEHAATAHRINDLTAWIDGVQRQLQTVTDESDARLARHIELVTRLATDLDRQHRSTEQQLSAMREELTRVDGELSTLEGTVDRSLATVRVELAALMAASVAAYDETESKVSQQVRPHVQEVRDRIQARAQQFRTRVEQGLLSRIDNDVRSLQTRMTQMAQRLVSATQQSQAHSEQAADTHSGEFRQRSGTDWRGGGGDVDGPAASRASTLRKSGDDKRVAVEGHASRLASTADSLVTSMRAVNAQYDAVHHLPATLDRILAQYGL